MRVFAIGVLSVAAAFAQAPTGTWKLNPAKSKSIGDLVHRTMTVTKTGPATYRLEFESAMKDGKTTKSSDERVCDGKEHASKDDNTLTYSCDEAKTLFKRNGKLTLEYLHSLSADGKTHTNSVRRFGPDGKVTGKEVRVFDRQ